MVRTPEQTRNTYACTLHTTGLQLEKVEVLPEAVTPGKEITQRLRYALCPLTPSGTLKGSITRTVLFKGKVVFRDATDYEFKPGTWTVDVCIGIPKEAASGMYTLDLAVRYKKQTLKDSNSFIVQGH